MDITFHLKSFDDLTVEEIYSILQLRSEVFVVEQECVYQDIDGKDSKALHLFGLKNEKVIAYARIFRPGDYFEDAGIGRVVVKTSERGNGYGHFIMQEANHAVNTHFRTSRIQLSAQKYLEKFYNSHGYERVGDGYMEDGIPHIKMEKTSA